MSFNFIVKLIVYDKNGSLNLKTGNFSLENQKRPGRPQVLETDDVEYLLKEDPRQKLNVDQSTILRCLHGKINQVGKWVP